MGSEKALGETGMLLWKEQLEERVRMELKVRMQRDKNKNTFFIVFLSARAWVW